tara:strand:+ start:3535 stop:3891 length:357 start_codon:yes stop_codon:yes gene_type:complete
MTDLASSAPHIHRASDFDDLVDWDTQQGALVETSHYTGSLLHKRPDNIPETGILDCTPRHWWLSLPQDDFCHFAKDRAHYTSDEGEFTDVTARTCSMFPGGRVQEFRNNPQYLFSHQG